LGTTILLLGTDLPDGASARGWRRHLIRLHNGIVRFWNCQFHCGMARFYIRLLLFSFCCFRVGADLEFGAARRERSSDGLAAETERMKWDALEEEPCSLARTVAVIGDRWSLMILRECFLRKRRFEAFQSSLGITRHLLAERLKKLVRFGVLRRIPYMESSKRYEYILT
jgi:DNA-binding HxlR family transcriptional regulator